MKLIKTELQGQSIKWPQPRKPLYSQQFYLHNFVLLSLENLPPWLYMFLVSQNVDLPLVKIIMPYKYKLLNPSRRIIFSLENAVLFFFSLLCFAFLFVKITATLRSSINNTINYLKCQASRF